MRQYPHRRRLLGAVTIILSLTLLAAVGALLGAPRAHAGGGGVPSKFVLKEQGQSVLVAYDTLAADGCTAAEVSINGASDITRMLPGPTETFGPGAFVVVTQWDQCDPNQPSYFYAGVGFDVSMSVAKSLSSATLTADIPVYLNGDETQPPAFDVTMTNLALTATAPAVHTVSNYQSHNPVSNYVAHINALYAPASAAGIVTLGPLGSASGADLVHGEIDSLKAGTTTVTRS